MRRLFELLLCLPRFGNGLRTWLMLDQEKKRHPTQQRARLTLEWLEDRVVPSTFEVSNTSNNAATTGSLPWAVAQANADTGNPVIIIFNPADFASATTITLASTLTLSNIGHSITIDGSDAGPITVSGGGAVEDFKINASVTATFNNLTISGGFLSGSTGGGIYNSGLLTLDNCTISGNSVSGAPGGGIYNAASVTVENCTISDNSASSGAGIWNIGNATVDSSTFSSNFATYLGAGIWSQGTGTITVDNCTASGNVASNSSISDGGAFYFNSGTATVDNCILTGNRADTGGAIENGATLLVENSTISGNTGVGSGSGGIDNGGTAVVINSIIQNNVATGGTGGVSAEGPTTLIDCTLADNSAAGVAGAIFSVSPVTVLDCTLTGNTATYGGALYEGTYTVVNSTITANSASVSGGGIYGFGSTATLQNTIVAGNLQSSGNGVDVSGNVTGTDSLIGNGTGMTGITNGNSGNLVGTAASPINADLGTLANNGGPTQTMPLLSGSPALGVGGTVTTIGTNGANNVTTAIPVTNVRRFAASSLPTLSSGSYFTIQIDGEQMAVTGVSVSGSTLTVVRGVNGTMAASHASGAAVYLVSDQRGYFLPSNNPPVVDMGAEQSTGLSGTLSFGTQPSSTTAGNSLGSVTVNDLNSGNPVAGATITVTSSGSLTGTTTATTNSYGVASFGGLSVGAAGTYSLNATASGATGTTSTYFVISVLAVTAVSSTTPAGTYGTGTLIPITVTFNAPVLVTGTPTLALNITPGTMASYASGGTRSLTTLATFTSTLTQAVGALVEDSSGNFFGTTYGGGASGDGTVFEVAAGSHTNTTLATFTGTANGSEPYGGLIEDSLGNLYGTTFAGGASNYGTVFEVAAGTHTLTTLATFTGANGINPYDSLVEDSSGNLFGTTYFGGTIGDGTVFEVAAGTHNLTTVADFTGTTGYGPIAGLVEDTSGNLFGTTLHGGAGNDGTVFEVAGGSQTVTTLAAFTGAANGANPYASLVEDSNGNFFGTTSSGGASGDGTVFEVAAGTHTLTTLATFTGSANGNHSEAGLVEDNNRNFFGVTSSGGASNDGTVFELAAGTHNLTTLATFTGTANGAVPIAGLVEDRSGNLFGTTYGGGASNDGTVFELAAGSSTLTFNYTVAAGQSSPRLDYTNTAALALNGGTITDAEGNNAILTLPATGSDGLYNQQISINTASTTTTLTDSGPNPSVVGNAVSYTVNTTAVPNGSTVYLEDASNSNVMVGSVVVSGGSGSTTIANLSIGSHEIFAVYTGGGGYASSQSGQLLQTVNPIQVSTPVVNGEFAPIVDLSESGNTAMIVTDGNNGFSAGDQVVIAGEPGSAAGYNGTWTILSASGDTFTYSDTATSLPVVTFDSNGYAISANSSSALVGKQRSMVDSVAYTFNTAVNLTAGAVTLGLANGVTTLGPATPATAAAGVNWTSLGGGTTWVLTFSSAAGNTVTGHSIADGVYTLTLNSADVTAVAGGSAMTTTRAADTFCRLYGDVTGGAGTQRVNGVDVTYFNDTYLLTDGQAGYLAALDYLGNGRVNANEIMPFTNRYLSSWSGFMATI